MGSAYRVQRVRRNHFFGSLLKAVVIVLAVMLFWSTFLWVGLDMHLPSASPAAVSAELEENTEGNTAVLDAGSVSVSVRD